VLLAYEQADGGFGPRVFAAGGLAIGLLGSLPVSIGDVIRAHGSTDALGVLAANSGLAVLACLFIASSVRGRTEKLERLAKELALGDLKVVRTDRLGNDKRLTLRELRSYKRIALIYGTVEKLEKDLAAAQVSLATQEFVACNTNP
jgi:HAMP domain-containing protein